jgi:hypothetical protein
MGTACVNFELGAQEMPVESKRRGRQGSGGIGTRTDAERNAQAVRRKPDARFDGGATASLGFKILGERSE